jgi:L-histidine Nalpha-methyltransferase
MAVTPPRQPLAEPAIRIDSHLDGAQGRSLADDVLDGLTRPFKELPPKHFYDARGAELFDRICELPEYYPTRAERSILEQSAADIARLTGAVELVELGSGTAAKTRVLLDALAEAGTLARYVPVDVTESMVRECAVALTCRSMA